MISYVIRPFHLLVLLEVIIKICLEISSQSIDAIFVKCLEFIYILVLIVNINLI